MSATHSALAAALLAAVDRAIDEAASAEALVVTATTLMQAAIADGPADLPLDGLPRGECYERYLVGRSPRHGASLFLMSWTPAVTTPIHDHTSWGVVGVLRGALHEQRYVPSPDARLIAGGAGWLRPGEVAGFVAEPATIHAVRASDDPHPVSLHLYGDAAAAYHVFDPETFGATRYEPQTHGDPPMTA